MTGEPTKRQFSIGFQTSIITVFVGVVLLVGLTLVYLSFARVTSITRTAARGFIEKVAQLGADHVDERFKTVRDNLDILSGLPAIQGAEIADNTRLYALMAAMLRNNPQLFNLYVGYEDGSFIEMDVIDRARPAFRTGLKVDQDAAFRLVVVARTAGAAPVTQYLSENLIQVAEVPGPAGYDPRQRPWYVEAFKNDKTLLTGPYVFYATGEPGYTLRTPLKEGRRGVVAGDVLLNRFEAMLAEQKLGQSGQAFLFNDADRIVGHPEMTRLMTEIPERQDDLPQVGALKLPGLVPIIRSWRDGGQAQQFFDDQAGRTYIAAVHRLDTTGSANVRLAIIAPLDEFYARIINERRTLFALALAFVGATLPFAFWLGSRMAEPLRKLVQETDAIQRFDLAERPRIRSAIAEIEELGRSVFTMRSVVSSFASFIPRPIVRQLIETGASLRLGGTRREVTVLFTDVADFTAKTERADPSQVMIYTSRYFAVLSDEIMRHRGTVDKYIGDAVMALWNAPADDPDHTVNACRAVLACLAANEALNKQFRHESWPPYDTRYGLNVGDAVVGNVGSSDRMNYTALGATVNLASRLEGLNKNYGTHVLVSAAVRERVGHAFLFRSVDSITPKGFAEPIEVSELRGELAQADASEIAMCRHWDEVFASIAQDGPAETTLVRLSGFLHDYPRDSVAQFHATRFRNAAQGTSAEA
ncbi:adenylate/guanylate cyclase domain-containing protein [Bradyrhizobium sp. WYCCWR 13023]|uniref:Adenylate/guanylate cyclase domain-containing protein n=1 Tax=Bradyrhizobium zhengyangense TaxID=2911009 RepID=A0A9X1RDJ4_9BRAD|nr:MULTISPECIES: adenylate/guanylate cyclase domain-containing protein [Bradyrhizobium]MCG2632287.1 adenylate/guanylate cyclase domain-containing protein [Bradyrhizobium zhengyangense]MDA9522213.1 adenylate cyclase [Bradyrhizobium sp. CCBAU 11434]